MKYISKLKIRSRFIVLGLVGLIMTAFPMSLYVNTATRDLSKVRLQISGIQPSKTLLKVIQLTQQHRGLSALVLSGNISSQTAQIEKQRDIDNAFSKLSELLATTANDPKLKSSWELNRKDWTTLKERMSSGQLTALDSFNAHTALIKQLLRSMDFMADAYELSLDPDFSSYELVQASLYSLPALTEEMGKSRGKGAGMLAKKTVEASDRASLNLFVSAADRRLEDMIYAFNKVEDVDAKLKDKLGAEIAQAENMAKDALELANLQILKSEDLAYSPTDYFNNFTRAIEQQFDVAGLAVDELDRTLKERQNHEQRTFTLISVTLIILISLGTAIVIVSSHSITKELGGEPSEVRQISDAIANSDLTNHIYIEKGMELSVKGSMAKMQESLRVIISSVRTSTDEITTSSTEIAIGNMELSARTEAQASSLEETAASMEELTSTVQQNADNARQANQLAQTASEVAQKGGKVVSQVIETMSAINDSSKHIVDIISVIDGIAFQTNILALNAAVEAARAGEQGRGFAVVATEVRNLAQRSAAAAKEIKTLIGASVIKVEEGSKLVDGAGQTMQDVVVSIGRVTDMMAEINSASVEQSQGISQVNEAVIQMDNTTQQNAALVEEAAAAAGSMQDQALSLTKLVSVFKLNDSQKASSTKVINRPSVFANQSPKREKNLDLTPKLDFAKASKISTKSVKAVSSTKQNGDEWEEF